jgi:hypothetical protein
VIRHARRSDNESRSSSIAAASRLRDWLTSFPSRLLQRVDLKQLIGGHPLQLPVLPLQLFPRSGHSRTLRRTRRTKKNERPASPMPEE